MRWSAGARSTPCASMAGGSDHYKGSYFDRHLGLRRGPHQAFALLAPLHHEHRVFGLTPVGPEPIAAEKCGAAQPKGGRMEGGILDHSRLLHTTEGDESRRIGLGSGIVDMPEVRSDLEQRRYPGAERTHNLGGAEPRVRMEASSLFPLGRG